jgi:hypothetical protein
MTPNELVKQLHDEIAFKRFIYAVLVHASGPPPYGDARLSWGGSGDSGPNIRIDSVTRADALKRAYETLSGQYGIPTKTDANEQPTNLASAAEHTLRVQRIADDLALATTSLFQGRGFVAWYAHWDNTNATTLEGILGIHADSGETRTIALWTPS